MEFLGINGNCCVGAVGAGADKVIVGFLGTEDKTLTRCVGREAGSGAMVGTEQGSGAMGRVGKEVVAGRGLGFEALRRGQERQALAIGH